MEKYINQLLADINYATENVSWPFVEKELNLHDWLPDEEEDRTAPVRNLEDWTGINKIQLPPSEKLTDEQVHNLFTALKNMLDTYNWSWVMQIEAPERIQYDAIRDNFNQDAKIKRWHMGFFEHCRKGTEHEKCALKKYCQCAFYTELFSGFTDEELSPEEERAMELECETTHLKRKHGKNWMKYYPYHLDSDYDDENGEPYDYGFGIGDDDDDEGDDWWRK